MKKTILTLTILFTLLSCSENEFISKAKSHLSKRNNIDNFKFEHFEINALDVLNLKSDRAKKQMDLKTMDEVLKEMGKMDKDLKYHKVFYYEVQNDTIHNGFIYYDEKGKEVLFDLRK